MSERSAHSRRKRHAQLRHDPRSTPLWVGDPEDWAMVREQRPPLVCPEPGCEVELISYENLNNRYSPRIFKFKSGSHRCDHWPDRGSGGGPETPQHDWMKSRLARISTQLGYTATPEDWRTRADVFVQEPDFCLEVQLRPTQFGKRTAARHGKGTQVCWLIREGLDTPKVVEALFQLPAVRFRIIDRKRKSRRLAPWDAPDDRDLAYRALIEVFGTVAHPPRPDQYPDPADARASWFRTEPMSGFTFLEQVLSGQRRWYPPRTIGHKWGLWALETDVAAYRGFRERQQAHARTQRQAPPVMPKAITAAIDPLTDPAETPSSEAADTPVPRTVQTEAEPATAPIPVAATMPNRAPVDRRYAAVAAPPRLRRRRWWQFWRSDE